MNARQRLTAGATPGVLVAVLAIVLCFGDALGHLAAAQTSKPATPPATSPPATPPATPPPTGESAKIPIEQLESLVAPIALYPDPLLAQTLAASTYPLEIVQLQQWLVEEPRPEGSGARHRRRQAALGRQHSGDGGFARCGQAPGR